MSVHRLLLQLNVNHSAAAQDLLMQSMAEWLIDLAVVTEPYRVLTDRQTWAGDANGLVAIISGTGHGPLPFSSLEKGRGFVIALWREILVVGAYFRGLNKLEFLFLNHNLITSVSRTLLSDLVGLKELYLGYNEISTLEPGTFQDLSQLEDLLLNGNKLSHIKVGTFAGLSKLKHLVLSDNNIHMMDNGVFSDLVELQRLHLNFNNITEIDKKISGLSSKVNVSWT
jgi:Leucine-rich repeat (LRR) protein